MQSHSDHSINGGPVNRQLFMVDDDEVIRLLRIPLIQLIPLMEIWYGWCATPFLGNETP